MLKCRIPLLQQRFSRSMPGRILFVTTALPYANGPFHIGHIMEYIQADIWVRFQRMQGHSVHFVCADDAHGAAIMLRAEADGTTPEELIAYRDRLQALKKKDLRQVLSDEFHGRPEYQGFVYILSNPAIRLTWSTSSASRSGSHGRDHRPTTSGSRRSSSTQFARSASLRSAAPLRWPRPPPFRPPLSQTPCRPRRGRPTCRCR